MHKILVFCLLLAVIVSAVKIRAHEENEEDSEPTIQDSKNFQSRRDGENLDIDDFENFNLDDFDLSDFDRSQGGSSDPSPAPLERSFGPMAQASTLRPITREPVKPPQREPERPPQKEPERPPQQKPPGKYIL